MYSVRFHLGSVIFLAVSAQLGQFLHFSDSKFPRLSKSLTQAGTSEFVMSAVLLVSCFCFLAIGFLVQLVPAGFRLVFDLAGITGRLSIFINLYALTVLNIPCKFEILLL